VVAEQPTRPAPVAEQATVEPVPLEIEEPEVVAREVTARTTAAASRGTAAKAKTPRGGDLDKKRMRAWALLSNWPADRERNAETLASAIASSKEDAAAFIAQYDAEQGSLVTANRN